MQSITYLINYANRKDWQADPALPRLGDPVPRKTRTRAIVHHTVGVDNDASVNVWETYDECFARMRRLQVIRPDLGLDIPYNYVAYPMYSSKMWPSLLVCEGRGADRSGAHTSGYNTSGIAIALDGNWEHYPTNFAQWAGELGQFFGWLKYKQGIFNLWGMTNLGSVTPNSTREVFGHRDLYPTACPGQYVYKELERVKIVKP